MIKYSVFLLTFFWVALAFGAEKIFFRIPYVIEGGHLTLDSIYSLFLKPGLNITPEDPAYRRTIEFNQVQDWNKLSVGQEINLYIKIKDLDLSKYRTYYFGRPVQLKRPPEGFKGNVFYMASYGKFTQSNEQSGDVTFYQNSPISLGTGVSYYPKQSPWSMASSLYYSYIKDPENNLNNKKTAIPPEIGASLYGEYEFEKKRFTGYLGFDYEKFSTFNIINAGDTTLEVDRNQVVYLTAGLSSTVEILKRPIFTKISFSRSIYSSTNSDNEEVYEGYRFLWYVNKKISNSFFIHSLFKYHIMDGPTELSTLRLGVGAGYIFL